MVRVTGLITPPANKINQLVVLYLYVLLLKLNIFRNFSSFLEERDTKKSEL